MASAWIPFHETIKIDILTCPHMTGREVYKTFKSSKYSLSMCNLSMYDTKTKINIVRMEDENVKSGYLFSSEGMGIIGDKTVIWCDALQAYRQRDIRDYTSFSPILLNGGRKVMDWGNKTSTYVQDVHKRTGICWNNQFLIMFVSDNKLTLEQERDIMADWDMWYGGNCDGGGSQFLVDKDVLVVDSVRENVTWLLAYTFRG